MENASKALIIAGAILLAILIIGLGIFIYNHASNAIGNTGMDQLSVQRFNAQFEAYEGTQSGAQVEQLLKKVMSSNYTYSEDESMQITINDAELTSYSNGTFHLKSKNDNIKGTLTPGKGKMYDISFDRNNKNGLIYNIRVECIDN